MAKLTRDDLYSLEGYARIRDQFRRQVMAHKRARLLPLGEHATLQFEDVLTMQYQVQEMLRLERIFEPAAIEAELAVYNPLIPDGSNWKATLMIEYAEVDERRQALGRLLGIEKAVWLQVAGCAAVQPIADEDLERQTTDKTAAVHFLRFELSPAMVAALKAGARLAAGIDHPAYQVLVPALPAALSASLLADLA